MSKILSYFALSLFVGISLAQAQAPTPCRNPQEGSPGSCVFIEDHHRCDVGSGTIPPSPVSTTVVGATDADKFNAVANKKLACCMNEINLPGALVYSKFDCVENASVKYTDFNDLWASTNNEDLGTMNAVLLTNGAGKPVTGFYTLNGARCDNLSEFLSPLTGIQPYKIDPQMVSGQQFKAGGAQPVGAPYPVPNSTAYSALASQLGINGKKYPDPTLDAPDAIRCPILVRAAMIASCGNNPALPIVQRVYSFPNGATKKTRCSVAASIQIQIRIEQLFEISGMPKMATIDTVASPNLTSFLSLERIIATKNGATCPNGSSTWNNMCKY